MPIQPLDYSQAATLCDPADFDFKTTEELDDLHEIIGQERAVESIEFGSSINHDGYNIFVMGPTGIGKHGVIKQYLEKKATEEKLPSDWCYVNNFDHPSKPLAIKLPSGQGQQLKTDMQNLVESLRASIPAAFESDEYQARKKIIEDDLQKLNEEAYRKIEEKAREKKIGLIKTPRGIMFAPLKENGEIMAPEEFQGLSEKEQAAIEEKIRSLHETLEDLIKQIANWKKEGMEKLKKLNRDVASYVAGHLIEELKNKYSLFPKVVSYLERVEEDVIENVDDFLYKPEAAPIALGAIKLPASLMAPSLKRYEVNVLVTHENHGAPIVYEDHPTHQNIIGRIEHISQMGTLVTDFTLIKPGALHKAYGGYLVIDALKLLLQPYAWETLKRAIQSKEIRIISGERMLGLISTVTLEPEPIPFNSKVILIGERILYYLLYSYDSDFKELFKIVADFEETMPRSLENNLLYARLIAMISRSNGLLPLDKEAVARVIDHSSRLASDTKKLSTHIQSLTDLLREADFLAKKKQNRVILRDDIQNAIDMQIKRASRIKDEVFEEIKRGTILIDTEGEKVGQINGLSVVDLGNISFGRPTRITARTRMGKGEVIDIEREVELGGPIHSKGVMILSSFLGARYAPDNPLTLSASLVFEQSYGGVEGDSASLAELCALLSSISQIPIRQNFAATGSINQQGEVQAIGGVNEKIEGFFDICKERGLTGTQGVLIPESNVKHLMLKNDVIEAIKQKKFFIYPIKNVDEAMEILTGLSAGERDESGNFAKGSINALVEETLVAYAQKSKEFSESSAKNENES